MPMVEQGMTQTKTVTQGETGRRLSFQGPLAGLLSTIAMTGIVAPPAVATENIPPPHATHSWAQRTIHSKAERIIVPPELDAVAGCESGSGPNSAGDYDAENKYSDASGRYQLLDSTLHYLGGKGHASDLPDWEQDKYAVKLYRLEKLSPWYASKRCWAGKVALIMSKKHSK